MFGEAGLLMRFEVKRSHPQKMVRFQLRVWGQGGNRLGVAPEDRDNDDVD